MNEQGVETKIRYVCSTCRREYLTIEEATGCYAKGFYPSFKVGDIVTLHPGYGWYDGDMEWVVNPDIDPETKRVENASHGNCFGWCCTYGFYYVITHIDGHTEDGHRPRYHVETKAMTGKNGHRDGYTFDWGHSTPKLVKNPPLKVVESSKELIGHKFPWLSH